MTMPQKTEEIKAAVQINEPSESLPSLYFSLASALSLASKYQTVMAYLRDKEDKKMMPDYRWLRLPIRTHHFFTIVLSDIQKQGHNFKLKDPVFHFSP